MGVTLELITPPRKSRVAKNRQSHPHLKTRPLQVQCSASLHSNSEPSHFKVSFHQNPGTYHRQLKPDLAHHLSTCSGAERHRRHLPLSSRGGLQPPKPGLAHGRKFKRPCQPNSDRCVLLQPCLVVWLFGSG